MLDIEDGFEYLFGEHTFPSFVPIFWSRKIVRENVYFFNGYGLFEVGWTPHILMKSPTFIIEPFFA